MYVCMRVKILSVLSVVNVGKSVVGNNDNDGSDNVGDSDGDDVVVDDDMVLVFEVVLVLLVEVTMVLILVRFKKMGTV